jgi:hypothetical protein
MNMEGFALDLVRMAVVFSHLIACCVAIGLVLTSDVAMVRQMLQGDPRAGLGQSHLEELQRTVARALGALWITGLALVWFDAVVQGAHVLANPKLHAKILVVVLLTINGLVLHEHVLPWMTRSGSVLRLSFWQSMLTLLSGAASGVSWVYAAMLGVGRPLSGRFSLLELMVGYPFLIAAGFCALLVVVLWSKYREGEWNELAPAPSQRGMWQLPALGDGTDVASPVITTGSPTPAT